MINIESNFLRWLQRFTGAVRNGSFLLEGERIWNGIRLGKITVYETGKKRKDFKLSIPNYGYIIYSAEYDRITFFPGTSSEGVEINSYMWKVTLGKLVKQYNDSLIKK